MKKKQKVQIFKLEERVLFDGAAAAEIVDAVNQAGEQADHQDQSDNSEQDKEQELIRNTVQNAGPVDTPAPDANVQNAGEGLPQADAAQNDPAEVLINGNADFTQVTDPNAAFSGDVADFIQAAAEPDAGADAASHELIVIDPDAADQFDQDAFEGKNVLFLDPDSDAADQIDEWMNEHSGQDINEIRLVTDSDTLASQISDIDGLEVSSVEAFQAELADADPSDFIVIPDPEFNITVGPQSDPIPDELSNDAGDGRHELVILNSSTADLDNVLAQLGDSRDILIIDNAGDAFEQISGYLDSHDSYDAVHILTHGNDKGFYLGHQKVVAADQMSVFNGHLTENGDFMIYGCNLAASEQGQALVHDIADLTGADVAASSDITGAAAVGGNWTLEYNSGTIETASISLDSSWEHRLADITISNDPETATNFNSWANYAAATPSDNDTVTFEKDDSTISAINISVSIIGGTYNLSGSFEIGSGKTLNLSGTDLHISVTGSGAYTLASGSNEGSVSTSGDVVISSGATNSGAISNASSVTISGTNSNSIASTGAVTISGTNTGNITQSGSVTINNGANNNSFNVTSSGAIEISNNSKLTGDIVSNSSLTVASGSQLTLNGASTLAGTLENNGTVSGTPQTGAGIAISGSGKFDNFDYTANSGTLSVTGSASFENGSSLTTTGNTPAGFSISGFTGSFSNDSPINIGGSGASSIDSGTFNKLVTVSSGTSAAPVSFTGGNFNDGISNTGFLALNGIALKSTVTNNGTITGSATTEGVTLNGTGQWGTDQGGTFSLTSSSGATTINGSADFDNATLTFSGTASLSAESTGKYTKSTITHSGSGNMEFTAGTYTSSTITHSGSGNMTFTAGTYKDTPVTHSGSGTLTISAGKFSQTTSGTLVTVSGEAKLNISGSAANTSFTGTGKTGTGLDASSGNGNFSISGGKFSGFETGVKVNRAQEVGTKTISGGEFTGNIYGVDNSGILTISGGTFQNNINSNNSAGAGILNSGTLVSVSNITDAISGNYHGVENSGMISSFAGTNVNEITISGSKDSGIYNTGRIQRMQYVTLTGNGSGNLLSTKGGGIYNGEDGKIAVIDSTHDVGFFKNVTITNNSAQDGAGIYNAGEIAFFKDNVDVIVTDLSFTDVTITGNIAKGSGGGIYNSGMIAVEQVKDGSKYYYINGGALGIAGNVKVANNTANKGGGVHWASGYLATDMFVLDTVAGSGFEGNHASYGAGLYVASGGKRVLHDLTFKDNAADVGFNFKSGDSNYSGGALYVASGAEVALQNVTFDGNSADNVDVIDLNYDKYMYGTDTGNLDKVWTHRGGRGGAIYNEGTLTVMTSEFKNNWANNDNTNYDLLDEQYRQFPNYDLYLQTLSMGGAIYNAGTITVTDSWIHLNEARNGLGGGVYNAAGATATLSSSEVYNGTKWGYTVDSNSMIVEGNTSYSSSNGEQYAGGGFGGGIYADSGSTLSLDSVTVRNNTARLTVMQSGGATTYDIGRGGGIYFGEANVYTQPTLGSGTLTIDGTVRNAIYQTVNDPAKYEMARRPSDIYNNTASSGAGLYVNTRGTVTVHNTEIHENRVPTTNTLFTNNSVAELFYKNFWVTSEQSEYTRTHGGAPSADEIAAAGELFTTSGVGIYASGSGATITLSSGTVGETPVGGVSVWGNQNATSLGGGLYATGNLYGSGNVNVNLVNTTFYNNTGAYGGGVYIANNSRVNILDSTIAGNTATRGGGVFLIGSNVTTNILNSIVVGNTGDDVAADSSDPTLNDMYSLFGTVKVQTTTMTYADKDVDPTSSIGVTAADIFEGGSLAAAWGADGNKGEETYSKVFTDTAGQKYYYNYSYNTTGVLKISAVGAAAYKGVYAAIDAASTMYYNSLNSAAAARGEKDGTWYKFGTTDKATVNDGIVKNGQNGSARRMENQAGLSINYDTYNIGAYQLMVQDAYYYDTQATNSDGVSTRAAGYAAAGDDPRAYYLSGEYYVRGIVTTDADTVNPYDGKLSLRESIWMAGRDFTVNYQVAPYIYGSNPKAKVITEQFHFGREIVFDSNAFNTGTVALNMGQSNWYGSAKTTSGTPVKLTSAFYDSIGFNRDLKDANGNDLSYRIVAGSVDATTYNVTKPAGAEDRFDYDATADGTFADISLTLTAVNNVTAAQGNFRLFDVVKGDLTLFSRAGGSFTLNGGNVSNDSNMDRPLSDRTNASDANYGGVLRVSGGDGTLTLSNVTAQNGVANKGAGIYVSAGTLNLEGATEVTGNTARGYELKTDTEFTDGKGAGIYVAGGTVNAGENAASNIRISGNQAEFDGGGIYAAGGTVNLLKGTAVSGNTASENGGGIYAAGGALNLTQMTVGGAAVADANRAANGAGIYIASGAEAKLDGVTLSRNVATEKGGAIYNAGSLTLTNSDMTSTVSRIHDNTANLGAGIYQANGTLNVSYQAIYNNHLKGSSATGAALYIAGGTMNMYNVTIAEHSSSIGGSSTIYTSGGTISIYNTTVAQNGITGLKIAGGTVNLNNTLLIGNGKDGYQNVDGTSYTPDKATLIGNSENKYTSKLIFGDNVFDETKGVIVLDKDNSDNPALFGGLLYGDADKNYYDQQGNDRTQIPGGGKYSVGALVGNGAPQPPQPPEYVIVNTFQEDNNPSDDIVSLREAIVYLQSSYNTEKDIVVKFDYDSLAAEAGGYNPLNWKFVLDDAHGGSLSLAGNNDAGISQITINGSFTAPTGTKQVMTVDGSALTGTNSVFSVVGMELALSNITVTGPAVSTANGSAANVSGKGGELSLNGNVTIQNSHTSQNGTIYVANGGSVTTSGTGNKIQNNTAARGGAVYAANGGKANLNSITIQDNMATADGGAIYAANGGTVNMTGSMLNNNDATVNGGAIYANGGMVSVTGGTISNSNAANGGAAYVAAGTVNMTGSTLNNNDATGNGGAIYANGGTVSVTGGTISKSNAVNGGAVYADGGTVSLTNSALNNNEATVNGGAVYAAAGSDFSSDSATQYISNRAADGGALYAENDIIANGIYKNNTATGGAVIHGEKSVTVSGNVSSNTANGGDVILADNGDITLNADMKNNTATDGSVLNAANGSVSVKGGTIQNTTGAVSAGVITASGDVVMDGTITGYKTTGPVINATNVSVSGSVSSNTATAGNVINATGDVTVRGSVSSNTATTGNVIKATNNVSVSGSVSNNKAENASVINAGNVQLSGAGLSGNNAQDIIVADGGTVSVSDSTVSGNTAGNGIIKGSTLYLDNAIISGNTAITRSVLKADYDVSVLNSTLSDNSASLDVIGAGGDVVLANATLANNTGDAVDAQPGTAKIVNSIVLGKVNAGDVQAAYAVFDSTPKNLSVNDHNIMDASAGDLFSGKDAEGHLLVKEDSVAAVGVWTAYDAASGDIYYSTRPEGIWTQGYNASNMQWNRLGGGTVSYATVSSLLLTPEDVSPSIGGYSSGLFHPDFGPGVNSNMINPSFNGGFGYAWGYNAVVNGYFMNPSAGLMSDSGSETGWYSTLLSELFGSRATQSGVFSVDGILPSNELDLGVDGASGTFDAFQESPYHAEDGTPLSEGELNAIRSAAVTGRIPAESVPLDGTVSEQVASSLRSAEAFKDGFDKALDYLLGQDA